MTLKQRRKNLCLSVDDLAEAIGKTPRTLRSYEEGTREPDLKTVVALAFALKTPVEEIVYSILTEQKEKEASA